MWRTWFIDYNHKIWLISRGKTIRIRELKAAHKIPWIGHPSRFRYEIEWQKKYKIVSESELEDAGEMDASYPFCIWDTLEHNNSWQHYPMIRHLQK